MQTNIRRMSYFMLIINCFVTFGLLLAFYAQILSEHYNIKRTTNNALNQHFYCVVNYTILSSMITKADNS